MRANKRRRTKEYRSAVITGASRGIGAAFAKALPETTDLFLTATNAESLDELAVQLERPGRNIKTHVTDLRDRNAVAALAEEALSVDPDLLINNAGIGPYGAFRDVQADRHLDAIDVNIRALTSLTHAIVPAMVDRAAEHETRAGLIQVSSSTGFVPTPRLAVYAASKAYVLSFTEALSSELSGSPIDILAFCPGAVRTEFSSRAGYTGGTIPGAMKPSFAARAALSALGRQRTLVLDPVGTLGLSPVALARSVFSDALERGMQRFSPPRDVT